MKTVDTMIGTLLSKATGANLSEWGGGVGGYNIGGLSGGTICFVKISTLAIEFYFGYPTPYRTTNELVRFEVNRLIREYLEFKKQEQEDAIIKRLKEFEELQ